MGLGTHLGDGMHLIARYVVSLPTALSEQSDLTRVQLVCITPHKETGILKDRTDNGQRRETENN
jgi:hypothetical protein